MHTTDDAQGDQATADQSGAQSATRLEAGKILDRRTLHITLRSIRTGMQCIDNDAGRVE
jgi:hypothetical protein